MEVTGGDQGIGYLFSFDFLLHSTRQTGKLGISVPGTYKKFSNSLQYFEMDRLPQSRLVHSFLFPMVWPWKQMRKQSVYITDHTQQMVSPNYSYLRFSPVIERGKGCFSNFWRAPGPAGPWESTLSLPPPWNSTPGPLLTQVPIVSCLGLCNRSLSGLPASSLTPAPHHPECILHASLRVTLLNQIQSYSSPA